MTYLVGRVLWSPWNHMYIEWEHICILNENCAWHIFKEVAPRALIKEIYEADCWSGGAGWLIFIVRYVEKDVSRKKPLSLAVDKNRAKFDIASKELALRSRQDAGTSEGDGKAGQGRQLWQALILLSVSDVWCLSLISWNSVQTLSSQLSFHFFVLLQRLAQSMSIKISKRCLASVCWLVNCLPGPC